jgi:hypothetical protein
LGLTAPAFGLLPIVLALVAQSLPDLGILANRVYFEGEASDDQRSTSSSFRRLRRSATPKATPNDQRARADALDGAPLRLNREFGDTRFAM